LVLTSASLVIEESTGLSRKSLKFFPKASDNFLSTRTLCYDIIDIRVTYKFLRDLKLKKCYASEDYALLLLQQPIERERYFYIGYDVN
jgi:hypothetical protein